LSDNPITATISTTDTTNNNATNTKIGSATGRESDKTSDLAVAINDGDGFVNATEAGIVSYTVSGLNTDTTATVTFSDGNPLHGVVASGLANVPATADLSSLSDGPITATISATDTTNNNATNT